MSSSIPGAVLQFIDIATAAMPADTTIWFGKPLPMYSAPLMLQITGVEGNQEPAELGISYRREEVFSILCQLSSFQGDQLFQNRMTEVFSYWEMITVAVANNPTLNQTVRFAEPGNMVFDPIAANGGRSIGCLHFDIRCSARITSLT